MTCSICKIAGHNKLNKKFHPKNKVEPEKHDTVVVVNKDAVVNKQLNGNMSWEEYNNTIKEIEFVAKQISISDIHCEDGRIDSAIKETPFLQEMKNILLEKHPDWEVVISPPRAFCDIIINSIIINLKLTNCKESDNSVNKQAIYYSITGILKYPVYSNWNQFFYKLEESKNKNNIKIDRYKPTEYHYLVKNKYTGEVLLKSIFDIHTYVSNASNDLQINWKNEFKHASYYTTNIDYLDKVKSLLCCIQKSIKSYIERTLIFAEADIKLLLISE